MSEPLDRIELDVIGVGEKERAAIIARLRELAHAVTKGPEAIRGECTMRVPAEPLRDADLVLSAAADMLESETSEPVVGPAAPSDEELLNLADDSDMDRLEGERGYPDGTVIKEGCWEAWDHQLLAFARAVLARFGTTPQPANGKSPTAGELRTMANMFGLEVNDWAALSWLVVTCIAAYGDGNTWKSTWKSIKSAPRDGTEILACDYDSVEIVSYDSHPSGMGNAWITRDGEEFYPDWYVDILEQPSLRHESLLTPIAPVEPLGPGNSTAPDDGELPEGVATLIPWLLESAVQAANAGHSTAAGNLTLAAQLLGEWGTTPTPIHVSERHRTMVKDAVACAIGASAYDCTRVWNAWSVGTMDQDDFAPIVDDDSRLSEIADAAINALNEQGIGTAPIPVAERLHLLQAGIRSGYMAGHDATVEGRYGDPDEVAADLAPKILQELDALPLPAAPGEGA